MRIERKLEIAEAGRNHRFSRQRRRKAQRGWHFRGHFALDAFCASIFVLQRFDAWNSCPDSE
jgi:hypothetical protein